MCCKMASTLELVLYHLFDEFGFILKLYHNLFFQLCKRKHSFTFYMQNNVVLLIIHFNSIAEKCHPYIAVLFSQYL